MFQTYVACYLWDLVDEGIDTVLDRLVGETGATGVCLAMCSPRVGVLRPHREVAPRTFRSEGGLQYQPSKDAYTATRLHPVVAEWLRKANPLAAVVEGCQSRGLALRGRITCCNAPALAGRYPSAAVKDVFGDVNPAWLCPSNPDVREYLRATVADLSGLYPFETLEIEAFAFPLPGRAGGDRLICPELGPAGEWLLRLCFCESCRQAAAGEGIDAAAAARSVTVTLEKSLASGEPVRKPVEDLLASDEILRAYVEWGGRQVTGLVALLRQACQRRLVVRRDEDVLAGGGDMKAIAGHCDALLMPPPKPMTDDVQPGVEAAAAEIGDVGRVEVGVSACAPECPDSAALVRALSTAARLGVRTAVVENYGLMPIARLTWIKQAVRYATREAE